MTVVIVTKRVPPSAIIRKHFYPKWLLKRTVCEKDLLNSPYGKISGNKLTVPLCKESNTQLGQELEVPVSYIEKGRGFSDFEAELLYDRCGKSMEYSIDQYAMKTGAMYLRL